MSLSISYKKERGTVIHDVSLNARDTDGVATTLAELLGGTVVAAPSPPFDPASRFVCTWDEHGTMIEIGPWGVTWQPDAGLQSDVVPIDAMSEHNYFHALFTSPLPVDEILAVSGRAQWPAAVVDNGPFQVVNVWIESRQLTELTNAELVGDYLATFASANRDQLDSQLREFEQQLLQPDS